jgi:hypothetical protein
MTGRPGVDAAVGGARRYYGCGLWAGKIMCLLVAVDFLVYLLLEWVQPRNGIDVAPDFSLETYQRLCLRADKASKDDGDARTRPPA